MASTQQRKSITAQDLAVYLNTTVETVYRLAASLDVGATWLDERAVYRRSDVERLLQAWELYNGRCGQTSGELEAFSGEAAGLWDGVVDFILNGMRQSLTTWRLLGAPQKPGEVSAIVPHGTVWVTQAHIDAAAKSGSHIVVALIPAADSQVIAPKWEIVRIGSYRFDS